MAVGRTEREGNEQLNFKSETDGGSTQIVH